MLRSRLPIAALLAMGLAVSEAHAQLGTFEVTYGAWSDPLSFIWTAGFRRPLAGPLDYSLSLSHLNDRATSTDRTQTGAELSMGWGRDGSGPYAVAAVGLGMKHYDGNFDAAWSAGGGWAVRLLPFLTAGIEARYRAEDQFSRGFWNPDPTDRRGPSLALSAALVSPRVRRAPRPAAAREIVSLPGRALAADVVQAALEAMGTPYRWGGDGANGYDCSGLIQFAYGQHGIILPRVSREQARLGIAVENAIAALHAGDILGFAVDGPGVTHVGLYIGEGQFIHSASSGVKLSSLTASDPDSIWWRRRWVQARRILQ